MSYFCYPPYNGIKAQMGSRPLTPEKCLQFYKKHTFNTLLLHRIKGLYEGDFSRAHAIESEIAMGERKCDYWYKRMDALAPWSPRKLPKSNGPLMPST